MYYVFFINHQVFPFSANLLIDFLTESVHFLGLPHLCFSEWEDKYIISSPHLSGEKGDIDDHID